MVVIAGYCCLPVQRTHHSRSASAAASASATVAIPTQPGADPELTPLPLLPFLLLHSAVDAGLSARTLHEELLDGGR